MDTIKVLVVDDHTLFRRGIAAVLSDHENLEVVGEALDGLEAIEKAKEIAPNVVLMDLNMPRCSGLEAIQALQTEMPQVNVLVLTVSDKEADLFAAMKFGARGYILKNTEPYELIHAIFHIAQEALTNIRRHALATKVVVKLENTTQVVEMTVRDNGQGFTLLDPEKPSPGYHGLNIMRERTEGLGGTLSISTAPGEGTEIRVSLPIEKVRL